MLKASYLKNKKSAIEVSLIHLLEIVLAIGVVILLIYFSLKLSGLFISRQEYDSAINNLKALAERVNELVKDNNNIKISSTVYSISDNYILVGFSNYYNDAVRTDCTQENIINSRPQLCQSTACLCIYQNYGSLTDLVGKDFDSKGNIVPLKCITFDERVIFLAPKLEGSNFKGAQAQWQPAYYPSSAYSYLVLYGKCGTQKSWKVRQVYIEKYKEGDNIFIFIGDMSNNKIKERSAYFKNRIS